MRINLILKLVLVVVTFLAPQIAKSQYGYTASGGDPCNGYEINLYYPKINTFNNADFFGLIDTDGNQKFIEWWTVGGGHWRIRVWDTSANFIYVLYENYTGTSAAPPLTGWVPTTLCAGLTPPTLTFVLPIDLVSFEVENKDGYNKLHWETAWEENNEGFEIEYATDGANWKMIDFKPGMGTYSGSTHYSYEHKDYGAGDCFYRLKQIDYDGRYEYSDVKQVFVNRDIGAISVYPNPTSTGVIWMSGLKENSGFTINDSSGRQLLSDVYSSSGIQVDGLSAGLYFIKINREDTVLKLIITE